MRGILNYWRLLLLIAVWVSGWGFACVSLVQAIKAYDVELSIQFFLRSLVIQLFLPTLLIAAIGIAFGLMVTMVWHPKWISIKKAVGRKTRHLATNIVK